MANLHELTKTAKANLERLADSTGAIVTYASASECEATTVERYDGGAGTVAANTSATIGGITGTISTQTAKWMYGKKVAGGTGPVVELTTVLAVDAETF